MYIHDVTQEDNPVKINIPILCIQLLFDSKGIIGKVVDA